MQIIALLLLYAASSQTFAGGAVPTVPEPGTLELLSIGAIAAVVMLIRKRRK